MKQESSASGGGQSIREVRERAHAHYSFETFEEACKRFSEKCRQDYRTWCRVIYMRNAPKFTKATAGTYVAGRFTIRRTYIWELELDDCKVMGYTSLSAAKAGAAELAEKIA
jgi:hypothetical protein